MTITKHLLFNLSLLLVFLFFFQIWFARRVLTKKARFILLIFIILAIILCMLFSIYIHREIRVDLRFIPMAIGSLYYGAGFLIAAFTILIRAFIGIDTGFWVTVIISLFLGVSSYFIRPYFNRQSVKSRIIISIMLNFTLSILFIEIIALFGQPAPNIEMWLSYLSISILGTGIITYALEIMWYNIKLQEQVTKAKKIEAVSQMGASIAHEIRNPLTAARGFLQFIKEDSNLEQRQTDYINIAIEELDQAEKVIGNYLTFAKPSIDQVEELFVQSELEQVLEDLKQMIDTNMVSVKSQFMTSGIVHGDRKMFRQCFSNIIRNCIEAMPLGGTLLIETYQSKDKVMIAVSDTGKGMTDEQLDRLGEPYYLINEGKGTGLGMMVVHSIIRAMNGSIRINSQLDKGTKFIIAFPLIGKTRSMI